MEENLMSETWSPGEISAAPQTEAAPQQQQDFFAPRAPRVPLRARPDKKIALWRMAVLVGCGLLCYAVIVSAAALIWGGLIYMQQGDVQEAAVLPLVVFGAAVFCSSGLVTLFSRGGTIFPALTVAVIVNIIPFFFDQTFEPTVPGLLLKLLCTLMIATVGFTLSKLWYIKTRF